MQDVHPGQSPDNTTQCKCGNGLGGVVQCNSATLQVSVLHCYCMTYNRQSNQTLVGHCTASYIAREPSPGKIHNQLHTNNSESINSEVCGKFNRDGQLCGKCIEGYGPPVYSYNFQCVKCDKLNFKSNLLKYIAVAFLPLTGFYLIVIVFKVRATAGFMVSYVMICQLETIPFQNLSSFKEI